MDFEKARFNMVEQQIRPWDVLNPRVLEVISQIPREQFTPDQYKSIAYTDTRIPVGVYENHPVLMAQPNINGRILQALDVQDDDLVLEIGTGTGYLTACLAKLGRHVDSVDINEELIEKAAENLGALGITNFNLSEGDASSKWEQKAAYDCIAITAAMDSIPEYYKKLLKVGGRMFVVTGEAPAMTAHLVTRVDHKNWTVEELFETSIDPIIKPAKQEFVF
jgi:protein-L-isoaspartate(D-aspartate) O-methyltransferase